MFSQKLLKIFGCTIRNCSFYTAKVKVRPCPRKPPPLNVAIISASCKVGRIAAMLLKCDKLFKHLFLYSLEDLSALMCDLCLINTNTKVTGFCGINSLAAAIKEARIILICDGLQTKIDVDEETLFKKNAAFVRQSILYCSEYNPHAFLVIASPPVASFVPVAIEEYKKADWLAGNRIFGLATTYVSRSNAICGSRLNLQPSKIHCQVTGGLHRRTCIPVLSKIQNAGVKRRKNEILTRAIQEAEEDALYAMKLDKYEHGCYLSTGHACAHFIQQLAKAINGQREIVECAYVQQEPPLNEYAKYFTTLCTIGPEGIISKRIPALSALEKVRLKNVIEDIRIAIHMGETYVTGDDRKTKKHRPIKIKPPKDLACKDCADPKAKKAKQAMIDKRNTICKHHPPPKTITIPPPATAPCPK